MQLRPITNVDKLKEFHRDSGIQYEFNPGGPNILISGEVVGEDGDIIGGGYVKVFAEAVISLDRNRTVTEKIWAIKVLLSNAIRALNIAKLEELHVFTGDDKFAEGLERLGFIPIPQKALVLEVSNGKE